MSDSLAIFMRGSAMLAQADTIQKAKELKSLALTAAEWARRKGLGEETVQYARSYALEAERKMGEMLAQKPNPRNGPKTVLGDIVPPKILPTLKELGIEKSESKRAQKLAALPETVFEQIKNGERPRSEVMREVAHVAHNSGQHEWFTPQKYIALAREVLGEIDLDPASSDEANKVIKAQRFYDAKDNGLTKEWSGKLWMNPPYDQPLISQFCEKLAKSYDAGLLKEAIALVNNATETQWFQRLAQSAAAICFPAGRIRFWYPGRDSFTPLQGQSFFYFGTNVSAFSNIFAPSGLVVTRL